MNQNTSSSTNNIEIITILKMLDYQHLVDWINESGQVHPNINDLNDEDFNQLTTYLIQSISHLISSSLTLYIPQISNQKLQDKISQNMKDLKSFSIEALEGEQVYHFIALWSTMRRELLHDFGVKT
ncbi:hypothetical protein MJH12_01875 [bacterium]|nr:hypothetical protein [bacterium]